MHDFERVKAQLTQDFHESGCDGNQELMDWIQRYSRDHLAHIALPWVVTLTDGFVRVIEEEEIWTIGDGFIDVHVAPPDYPGARLGRWRVGHLTRSPWGVMVAWIAFDHELTNI